MSDKITKALLRWHHARLARNATRKAMSRYLADAWGELDSDEDRAVGGSGRPRRHGYGACQLGYDHEKSTDYEPVMLLCDVCRGSQPLYTAMVDASKAHGAALRGLQGVARTMAKDEAEFRQIEAIS